MSLRPNRNKKLRPNPITLNPIERQEIALLIFHEPRSRRLATARGTWKVFPKAEKLTKDLFDKNRLLITQLNCNIMIFLSLECFFFLFCLFFVFRHQNWHRRRIGRQKWSGTRWRLLKYAFLSIHDFSRAMENALLLLSLPLLRYFSLFTTIRENLLNENKYSFNLCDR